MAWQLLIDSPVLGTIVVMVAAGGSLGGFTSGAWRKRLPIGIEGER